MRLSAHRSLVALGLSSLLLAGPAVASAPHAVADPPDAPVTDTPGTDTPVTGTPGTSPLPEETSPLPADPADPDPGGPVTDQPPAAVDPIDPESSAPPPATDTPVAEAADPVVLKRDVVVYGGTPGGVAAAVAAAEEGSRVVLVTERATVGGMMSNGISASDIGSSLAVQGLAKKFFARVRAYYGDPTTWRFEPRIAERILLRMLSEAGVTVVKRSPVTSVAVAEQQIRCGRFGGYRICARTFVDASYSGDLMAAGQVPFRLGMADFLSYRGETLTSLRGWARLLSVPAAEAAAARAAFEDNPFVTVTDALEPYAEAYRRGTPSITYRLCVTTRTDNKIPFRAAASYAALRPSFRLLAARMRDEVVRKSNGTLLSDAFQLAAIPGGKYDLNSGRLSFTNLPTRADYFAPGNDRRADDRLVREYVESFFYFVQRDGTVPASIRGTFSRFGLCADEFTDNGGWPREPYLREGRRLGGRYTMTQPDIFTRREKGSAIALASYNLDSKLSQMVFADRGLYRDIGVHATAPVYEVPYSAMVPRVGGLVNLLVPVGLSASPTAFGSLRMEPQWMALGEAAGVAAAVGLRARTSVGALSPSLVQKVLRARGVLHKAEDVCRRTPSVFRAAGGYTIYCDVLAVTPRPLK